MSSESCADCAKCKQFNVLLESLTKHDLRKRCYLVQGKRYEFSASIDHRLHKLPHNLTKFTTKFMDAYMKFAETAVFDPSEFTPAEYYEFMNLCADCANHELVELAMKSVFQYAQRVELCRVIYSHKDQTEEMLNLAYNVLIKQIFKNDAAKQHVKYQWKLHAVNCGACSKKNGEVCTPGRCELSYSYHFEKDCGLVSCKLYKCLRGVYEEPIEIPTDIFGNYAEDTRVQALLLLFKSL